MTDRQKIVNFYFQNDIKYETGHRKKDGVRQIGVKAGDVALYFDESERVVEVVNDKDIRTFSNRRRGKSG